MAGHGPNNLTSCKSARRLSSGNTSLSHLLTAVRLYLLRKRRRLAGRSTGKLHTAPKFKSVEEIPSAGWDEWYIFDKSVDLGTSHIAENIFEVPQEQGHVSVFVNYGFALHTPERKELATLFWQQIARIRPESYVADNDYLTFVSGHKALFASVLAAVKALSSEQ
jgi:hypothetical protein